MLFMFEGVVVIVVTGFKSMLCHTDVGFCIAVLGYYCGFVKQVVCQARTSVGMTEHEFKTRYGTLPDILALSCQKNFKITLHVQEYKILEYPK